jgi:hypothetical protein
VRSAPSPAARTIARRLNPTPGGAIAPIYNPAYSEACALDPYYADIEETRDGAHCSTPELSYEHMDAAHALVLRVGGPTAASQFARLFAQGCPKDSG